LGRLAAASGRDRALPRGVKAARPSPAQRGLGPFGSRSHGAWPRCRENRHSTSSSNAPTCDPNPSSGRPSAGCRGERQRSAAVVVTGWRG